MKKIYYTVDVEFHDNDFELGPTGNKTINAYEAIIEDGVSKVKRFFDVECLLSENSTIVMKEWLNDNGYEDIKFEFEQL